MLRSWLKCGETEVEAEATTLPPQEYRVSQTMEWEVSETILSIGRQQPSTHGVLRLALVTDGEIVKKVTPHLGYMHRCFEKHAEAVDYPGIIPYTDRVDYLASMNQNITYALTVEKL